VLYGGEYKIGWENIYYRQRRNSRVIEKESRLFRCFGFKFYPVMRTKGKAFISGG